MCACVCVLVCVYEGVGVGVCVCVCVWGGGCLPPGDFTGVWVHPEWAAVVRWWVPECTLRLESLLLIL